MAPHITAHFVCLLSGAGRVEWRSCLLMRAVKLRSVKPKQ